MNRYILFDLSPNYRDHMFKSLCYEYLLHDQFFQMLKDIEKNQNKPHKGVYKGISWEIRRPSRTYLCGYIYPKPKIEDNLDEEDRDNLERLSHMGLTCGLGFDCAHYGDYFCTTIYPPHACDFDFYNSTLKRLPGDDYVKDILKGGLDYLEYILKHNYLTLGLRTSIPNELRVLNIGIHKDYDYVLGKIKDMIDYIVKKYPNK